MQMLSLLENLEGHYLDGLVCESEGQMDKIWKIREAISLATAHYGLVEFKQCL